jgi:iron-sulfur cluster repair protein YtfE (RIC family)
MAKTDPADMSMMFFLHTAFRRDLDRLATAVEALPDGARARGEDLARRWEFVGEALHHHHTGEDEHLWPLARSKAPDSAAVLDEMQAEHPGHEGRHLAELHRLALAV